MCWGQRVWLCGGGGSRLPRRVIAVSCSGALLLAAHVSRCCGVSAPEPHCSGTASPAGGQAGDRRKGTVLSLRIIPTGRTRSHMAFLPVHFKIRGNRGSPTTAVGGGWDGAALWVHMCVHVCVRACAHVCVFVCPHVWLPDRRLLAEQHPAAMETKAAAMATGWPWGQPGGTAASPLCPVPPRDQLPTSPPWCHLTYTCLTATVVTQGDRGPCQQGRVPMASP